MTENKTEKILKQVQNDKSVETGRTMVEILGVLVIVGILSVSSIWGLSQTFNKNSANEITHELSQRAIVISSIKEGKSEASLDEFKDSGFTKKFILHCR